MIEWCATPKPASQGVAYKDFAYLYRDDGKPLEQLRNRSPRNNIYVGIHQSLLSGLGDATLDAAIDRCWKIYSRTFWANWEALIFCQSCSELAKRGQNVDQITIVLGPGGVGLSLYTAHIAAMLGTSLHRFSTQTFFTTTTSFARPSSYSLVRLCFLGRRDLRKVYPSCVKIC